MNLLIKYHVEQPEICLVEGKSNWYDLRAAERVELKAFDFKLISLGISCKIPDGMEAHIAPRSSTYKNWGVIMANGGPGIVDTSYCGDGDIWRFPAIALRDTVIEKGDRICQFRLIEAQPEVDIVKVDTLNAPDRGGFGSTGVA